MSYCDPESVEYDGNELEPKEERLGRITGFISRLCDRIILNNTTYFHSGGPISYMNYSPEESARIGQRVAELAAMQAEHQENQRVQVPSGSDGRIAEIASLQNLETGSGND